MSRRKLTADHLNVVEQGLLVSSNYIDAQCNAQLNALQAERQSLTAEMIALTEKINALNSRAAAFNSKIGDTCRSKIEKIIDALLPEYPRISLAACKRQLNRNQLAERNQSAESLLGGRQRVSGFPGYFLSDDEIKDLVRFAEEDRLAFYERDKRNAEREKARNILMTFVPYDDTLDDDLEEYAHALKAAKMALNSWFLELPSCRVATI